MNGVADLLALASIAIPMAASIALMAHGAKAKARWVAVVACMASLGCALGTLAVLHTHAGSGGLEPMGHRLPFVRFSVDGPRSVSLVIVAILPVVVALGMTRAAVSRGASGALLALAASDAGLVCADNMLTIFVLCVLGVLATVKAGHREVTSPSKVVAQRLFVLYLGGALVLFVAVSVALWTTGEGYGEGLWLVPLESGFHAGSRPTARGALLVVLGLLALVRQGIVPFHSWLPATAGASGDPALMLFVGAQTLTMAVLPLVSPVVAGVSTGWAQGVVALGAVTAIYGGALSLGQTCLRRTVASVVMGQGGFLAASMVALPEHGRGPALFQLLSHALTSTGLLALTAMVVARVGSSEFHRMGGLARKTPGLAVGFVVLALASAGLPGTMGFAADDLPLHGLAEFHPAVALAFLGASALSTTSLFRAYGKVFLGKPGPTIAVDGPLDFSLLPRERAAMGILLLAVFGLGLWPQMAIELLPRAPDAEARASASEHAGEGP